jgi:hypothetical protein
MVEENWNYLEHELRWLKIATVSQILSKVQEGEKFTLEDMLSEANAVDKKTVKEYLICQVCIGVV